MMLWRMLWRTNPLILAVMIGCSGTPHVVRVQPHPCVDPENVVPIKGHKGPHPERYHQIIYRELRDATDGCSSIVECRAALTGRLKKLAKEIATPGTELNQFITRTQPR